MTKSGSFEAKHKIKQINEDWLKILAQHHNQQICIQ